MSKNILVRSPYYNKFSHASLSYTVLKLYVYTGILTTDKVLRYTITKNASIPATGNPYTTFEIAELIRDFIDIEVGAEAVWIKVEAELFDSSDVSLSTDEDDYAALDGYRYFSEGNPTTLTKDVLMDNTVFYKEEGKTAIIPFLAEDITQICFYGGAGEELGTNWEDTDLLWNEADYLWSERFISCVTPPYISTLSADVVYYATVPADTEDIIVTTSTESINLVVKNICEPKHTAYVVSFINRYGVTQELTFFKKSSEMINVTGESYKSNLFDQSTTTFDNTRHQYKSFEVNAKETITMNTGFISEEHNEIIRQLMISEGVWINKGGQNLPITHKTTSMSYKTVVNDKLINYTVEFDYAYDLINNIR